MNEAQFKTRTKSLAIRVIRKGSALPKNQMEAQVIGKQLLRSATSVGANYRAACRPNALLGLSETFCQI